MAKILSMPASVPPTPQSFSILSAGVLQNGCTQTGLTAQTGYMQLAYNATGKLILPETKTGYTKLKVVVQSGTTYSSVKASIAGHEATAPKNTSLNTISIDLGVNDVYSEITLTVSGGTDNQKVYDAWLEP